MFSRTLKIAPILKNLSVLLLGPRQTGKSTLLKHLYPKSQVFDLLDPALFRDLNKSPQLLKELVKPSSPSAPVIIDEVQKLPELLDVIQSLIQENKNHRFILTGSSARKLRRQGQNLLGGRAYPLSLHPIISAELFQETQSASKINRLLQVGGLPAVLESESPQQLLKAYVGVYLQEEIKAEGFARSLSDFSNFIEVAALTNGEQLDFSGVSRDVQLSSRTVASYYAILQDTLLGFLLNPFRETKIRKPVMTPKFYYFDVGVCHFLTGREHLSPGTPEYGKALEHFIFKELVAFRDYNEMNFELFYWCSISKFEVDFIIRLKNKKLIGIEVKGTNRIDKDDLKGFKAFEDDFKLEKKFIVCLEPNPRLVDNQYNIIHYVQFCKLLWAGEII